MAIVTKQMPRVAILLASPYSTHREILRGILNFTRQGTPWALDVRMGRADEPETFDPAKWGATGLITNRMTSRLSAAVRRMKTPVVVLNDIWREGPVVARILSDNAGVAKTAAAYLSDAGFTNFAFVGGLEEPWWAAARCSVFASELARRDGICHVCPFGRDADSDRLKAWLAGLPKPVGLFASHDLRARQVLDACRDVGIDVPGEVAILGVDNDEVICETATPTLSSIPMTTEEAGFRAAELLNAVMLSGRHPQKTEKVFFTGTQVVTRQSTMRDFSHDVLVRRCRELMEANAGTPFKVADLVMHLNVSRRTLETRFRTATGRTLNAEITDLRIRRAKALLDKTTMIQEAVAQACGFCDASHLNVILRKHCGVRPSAFRRR